MNLLTDVLYIPSAMAYWGIIILLIFILIIYEFLTRKDLRRQINHLHNYIKEIERDSNHRKNQIALLEKYLKIEVKNIPDHYEKIDEV